LTAATSASSAPTITRSNFPFSFSPTANCIGMLPRPH
jgi:hypothetical protein